MARSQPRAQGGSELEVDIRRDSGGSVIELRGELDLQSAPRLRSALQECFSESPPALALDLAGVTYADSMGLSLLVAGHRRADADGFPFVLRHPSPQVLRVLEVSGLAEVLELDPEGPEGTGRPAGN